MKRKILVLFYIITIVINCSYTIVYADDFDDLETIDVNSELVSSDDENSIKLPEINSRAYVVIDRNSNMVLCGKNDNEKRKMASTTKILTATLIIENCNLNETVEVSKKSANTGGSRLGLKTGDKITVLDLLYGLMLCSGNDAAVALAEYCSGSVEEFANLMNKKALELNLTSSHFETPHGLDAEEHYTTAYELALLSNYALENKTFAKIVGTKNHTISINGTTKNINNTNELLGNLEGIYGIKTGFTNGANRCLVTACKRGELDIICVVLGADTKKFRTTDSIKLINYVFQNFKQYDINEFINNEFDNWKNENLNSFTIEKGISNNIIPKLDKIDLKKIPVRKDLINTIHSRVTCTKELVAPVYQNAEIGKIHIIYNNEEILETNIYSEYEIPKKNMIFYIKYLTTNFYKILNTVKG